jgi:hypothetical protein
MSNNTLELVAKLLAQAEGAGTEHEADAFNEAAQRIAASNSIDVAMARHYNQSKQSTKPIQRSIIIGVPGTEGLKTLVHLYLGIAAANDIECLIAHNSTRVYAIGFEEDIDVSEALYASLVTQMTTFVTAFKKEGSWRDEQVWADGWYSTRRHIFIPGRVKPINWRAARLNFQTGYANRIAARLFEVHLETRRQRITEEKARIAEQNDTTAPGTELVLASKRLAVHEMYEKEPKTRRSWNGSLNGQRSSAARQAGAAAADRASFGAQTPLAGQRKGIES